MAHIETISLTRSYLKSIAYQLVIFLIFASFTWFILHFASIKRRCVIVIKKRKKTITFTFTHSDRVCFNFQHLHCHWIAYDNAFIGNNRVFVLNSILVHIVINANNKIILINMNNQKKKKIYASISISGHNFLKSIRPCACVRLINRIRFVIHIHIQINICCFNSDVGQKNIDIFFSVESAFKKTIQ